MLCLLFRWFFSISSANFLVDQQLKKVFVFLYEPAMTVQYRFLRYLGVGGGLGYRLAFTNASLDESLNAPVYIIGVKVFFGDLYRDVVGED